MESKETQTSLFDDIHETLNNTRDILSSVAHSEDVTSKTHRLHTKFEGMKRGFGNMNDKIHKLEKTLTENTSYYIALEREYEKLRLERDRLLDEEKKISNNKNEPSLVKETSDEMIERNLLDYAMYDAAFKEETFQILKSRSAKLDEKLEEEWKRLKYDIKQFREQKRCYTLQIENVQNIALFKFREMMKYCTDSSDKSEIHKSIDFLQTQRQVRQLMDEIVDLRILTCDLENEISALLSKKNILIDLNNDREDQIYRMGLREEFGYPLHRAPRHADLPNRDSTKAHDVTNDVEEPEETHCHGRQLHRCNREMDLSVPLDELDAMDRSLFLGRCESSLDDDFLPESEESFEEESLDDQEEHNHCGMVLHRCHKKINISLPPELLDEGERAVLLGFVHSNDDIPAHDDDVRSEDNPLDTIQKENITTSNSDCFSSYDAAQEEQECGIELHRCPRSIHIALPPFMVEEADRCLVMGLQDSSEADDVTDSSHEEHSDGSEQDGAESSVQETIISDFKGIIPIDFSMEGYAAAENPISLVEKIRGRVSGAAGISTSSPSMDKKGVFAAGSVALGKQSSARHLKEIRVGQGSRRGRR